MSGPLFVFALEPESQNLFWEHNLLYTGVGKINASYQLTKYLAKETPSLVINLGTAGSAKHAPGTLLHSTKFIQRDMDVTALGFERWVTPFSDQPAVLEYGLPMELPHGICGTGDSFDIAHSGEHYDFVDMEAYALAHICKGEKIPFACIKYISDSANGNAPYDWDQALKNAATKLKQGVDLILNRD